MDIAVKVKPSYSNQGNHGNPTTAQRETSSKNLELLTSIMQEYSPSELENEIFTLHEVGRVKDTQKKKKTSKEGENKAQEKQ